MGPAQRRAIALLQVAVLAVPTWTVPAVRAAERSVVATVTVSPLLVSLELEPSTARVGERVKVRAVITNASDVVVRNVEVVVRVDAVSIEVKGGAVTLRRIAADTGAKASWSLCGREPGTYLVLVQASLGSTVTESPARLVTVLPGRPRNC